MGHYYANGAVTVIVPEPTSIVLVLALDAMPVTVRASTQGPPLDVVSDVLVNACKLAIGRDETDETGTRTVVAYNDDNWSPLTGDAFEWLAVHGAGVSGMIFGENGEAYEYDSVPGGNSLRKHHLGFVRRIDTPILLAAHELRNAIQDIEVENLDIPENARTALTHLKNSQKI